jgi:hypothetical protein
MSRAAGRGYRRHRDVLAEMTNAIREAARSAWTAITRWARATAARVRGESTRRRIAWSLVACVLTLGPLIINLLRESTFHASVKLDGVAVAPFPAPKHVGYVRHLLRSEALQSFVLQAADLSDSPGDIDKTLVRVHRKGNNYVFVVTARSATPQRAADLAKSLGVGLPAGSSNQLGRMAKHELKRVRSDLKSKPLTPTESVTLTARAHNLRNLTENGPQRVIVSSGVETPKPTRWGDRLADALPGPMPPRPSPILSALAGLLVAVSLWIVWLVRVPPDRARATGDDRAQATGD